MQPMKSKKKALKIETQIVAGALAAMVVTAGASRAIPGIPSGFFNEMEHIPTENPTPNLQLTVYAVNTSTSASVMGV